MTEVVECLVPSLAACQNSNATRNAWATVNVTAWAWDRREQRREVLMPHFLSWEERQCRGICFTVRGSVGLTYNSIYRQKERQGVSLTHTHTHTHTHSPLSSWCRGTRDTPAFRCVDSERCRRTLYHASYQLCSTISYRHTNNRCKHKLYISHTADQKFKNWSTVTVKSFLQI